MHAKDILYFLRKQGWIIGLVFVLVTGTAVFYTLGQQDIYQAETKISITPQFTQNVLPRQMVSYESYYLTNLTFDTEIQVLRSRPLAERIARALAASEHRQDEKFISQQTQKILRSLQIFRIENTRLIRLVATSNNPEEAARIANAAAEQYIYLTAESRLESYRKTHTWLQEQIADLEAKVELSEQALIDYIKETDLTLTEAGIPASSAPASGDSEDVLSALRAQLVSAEIERSRLQERYKPKHPKMIAIERELEIIRRKISEERQLRSGAIKEARETAISDKEKAIRYELLKRTAETNKQLYDALIEKLKETDVTSDLTQPDIQIIEAAEVPKWPIGPNRTRIAMVGATSGLFLGLLLAMLIEWLNPRIRSLEEFQRHFSVPVLATVPRMDAGGGQSQASLVAWKDPQTIASEAFRTLRTNVKFSHARDDSNTLLITSCLPQEGKTTVASNLAATVALSGRRVVLVDADLRNPSVHKHFQLGEAAGLAHLLAGELRSYKDALSATPIPNLSIIPAGLIPPNPSELLDSGLVHEITETLSRDFDQVIFDSPPVLAVTDTSLLASALRNVLLVLDMNHLNRLLIQRSLDQLSAAKARIYGAALNFVEPDLQHYYYPSYVQPAASKRKG